MLVRLPPALKAVGRGGSGTKLRQPQFRDRSLCPGAHGARACQAALTGPRNARLPPSLLRSDADESAGPHNGNHHREDHGITRVRAWGLTMLERVSRSTGATALGRMSGAAYLRTSRRWVCHCASGVRELNPKAVALCNAAFLQGSSYEAEERSTSRHNCRRHQ